MTSGPDRKVTLEVEADVARIWLDRPEVHNAFDADVIAGLADAIEDASTQEAVRVIVLGGRGRSFSAGADLNWMQRAAGLSADENSRDATRLAAMLRRLQLSPKATVARVQGAALGGGLGLVAACDIAVAASRAKFGFSEVKLGLIPAVISPHVVEKIGPGRARALFITGERFDASFAERIGLVTRVVEDEEALDRAVGEVIAQVRTSGPDAVRGAKELIREVLRLSSSDADRYTAGQIAHHRASAEGAEGIAAFLQKRAPAWAAPQ